MTDLTPLVRLVDDDEIFLMSQKLLLQTCGFETVSYASAEAFLEHDLMTRPGCLIADVRMPGLTGLDLQKVLQTRRFSLPMIFLTGHGDVNMAVHTMRNGASDFLEKPVKPEVLIAAVKKAVVASCEAQRARDELNKRRAVYDELTPREREVIELAAFDTANKAIAQALGISEPTVKMHRANAFAKLGVKSPLEAYRRLTALGIIREKDDLPGGLR